jgi:hypothetical protein
VYFDQIFGSDERKFKLQNGIDVNFDENGICDRIEQGLDSLENYSGAELALLEMVFAKRSDVLKSSDVGDTPLKTDTLSCYNKTRYSYYRKAKVLEYASFVDNVYAQQDANFNGVYALDPNYGQISSGGSRVFDYSRETPSVNATMVEKVSEYLAETTVYLQKLRNKIKLQMRKNYMKGTMNLLTYVINEFLVDYSRLSPTIQDRLSNDAVLSVFSRLSSSNIDDVKVIEYYDTTEYFNLQTDSSTDSINDQTNPHFKDEYFKETADGVYDKSVLQKGMEFSLQEIERFYLSSLNMASKIGNTTDDFIKFLDTIYSTGSNDSFIDKNGNFSYRISADFYASDMYQELTSLSDTFEKFREFLSAGDYEYPEGSVGEQISDAVNVYIRGKLSSEYLSAISDTYDEFKPKYDELSSQLESISSVYDDLLSGQYGKYFVSTDCKYSYEDNVYGNEYRHDFYVGNPEKYGAYYLIDKLTEIRSYSEGDGNIVNHEVMDTLYYVNGEFQTLSDNLVSKVGNNISEYGYIDVKSPYMETEMDSMTQFIDLEIEQRK